MKVALCASVASGTNAAASAAYGSPRIHIKGSAHIEAHVLREHGLFAIAGALSDDAGRPIDSAISITSPSTKLLASPAASQNPGWGTVRSESADRVVVIPDRSGRFWVQLAAPDEATTLHLSTQPAPLLEASSLDLAVDPLRPSLALRFERDVPALHLEDASAFVDVLASADMARNSAPPAAGLALTLSNERGELLASATTDDQGRGRFQFEPRRAGPPGEGELRVRFAGAAELAPVSQVAPVERRTRVDLDVREAPKGVLPSSSSDDAVTFGVRLVARCVARGCTGAQPSGVVEARLAGSDRVVSAAPITQGAAQLAFAWATATSGDVPLRLSYVPDAPWYEAGPELTIVQPLRPPNPWRRAPLVLAALVAAAWVVLSRLPTEKRGASRATLRPATPTSPRDGVVEIVHPQSPPGHWVGRVVDAHDQTAIGSARISIQRPGFEHIDVVVETTSDGDGRFDLQVASPRHGDLLVVEAPDHADLRVRLSSSGGELTASLVSRRRALLDRLVRWARRQGGPFHAEPEATPGHVLRVAGSDGTVADWAQAVERAVYSDRRVDERAEAEVTALEPRDDR